MNNDSFTPEELLTIPWSCKFCGIYKAPADPTQFDNRAVTKGNYCAGDLSASSFYDQAVKRIQDVLTVANHINELSTDITSKFGRQEPCLLDYKQLGVALLSPHGREGWGLVDYAWSMLEIYPKDERDKLSLSPARHDVVICACGPQINMLEATKYNRCYLCYTLLYRQTY